MMSNLKQVPTVEIPDGNVQAVNATIETVKAYLATLTEPTIKQFDGFKGMCKLCEWPVNEDLGTLISGPVKMAINTTRILTKAGLRVWMRTGVCEKCVNEKVMANG